MSSDSETPSRVPRGYKLIAFSVAVVIVVVGSFCFMPADIHFRIFQDERSFNLVMSQHVSTATTQAEIYRILGTGTVITEQERQRLLKATRDFQQQTPAAYPDGTTDDDQFVGYDLGTFTTYLQFRNGRIVNFNPREFDVPFQFTAIRPGQP